MKVCLAPSEIHGITSRDASIFGNIAEEYIYADFIQHYGMSSHEIFFDDYNEAGYIYFLAINNLHFGSADNMKYFYYSLRGEKLGVKRPDIMLHTLGEQSFYEIKPDSVYGRLMV